MRRTRIGTISLVPAGLADERVPGASREVLRGTCSVVRPDGLSVFAASLFSNNAQVSIMCFALGFAFGMPTLLLLVQNTAMLGAMLWLYPDRG
jgi:uncharacterized membrane protein SpoIIM required for sporulation